MIKKISTLSFLFALISIASFGQGAGQPCGSCLICDVGLLCDGSCVCNAPLPIVLLDFDAKQAGDQITLSWTTASEVNNGYFSIERGSDGVQYDEIAQLKGMGNSTAFKHYTFDDPEPLAGINYYRLKQTNYDGKYEYYWPKAVDFVPASVPANINWANNSLKVSLTSANQQEVLISVVNLLGQTIYHQKIKIEKGSNEFDLQLSGEVTEVLFFCETIGAKQSYRKIVKNKHS